MMEAAAMFVHLSPPVSAAAVQAIRVLGSTATTTAEPAETAPSETDGVSLSRSREPLPVRRGSKGQYERVPAL